MSRQPSAVSRIRGETGFSAPGSRLTGRSSPLETPFLVAHLAALALALGPPVFFGAVVAPSAFRVLPTRDLAAELVSPIVSQACLLAEIGFGTLMITSWFLTREGVPRLTRVLMTRISVIGFFAALVVRQLILPAIDKIRVEAPGLIDTLPAADPGRLLLARYHRLATGFLGAGILAALIVLFLTARLLAVRRAAPSVPAAVKPPLPKLLDLSDL